MNSRVNKRIVALAYFHRYGWIALAAIATAVTGRPLLSLGVCFLAYALYTLIGYRLKWRHIFCSNQNAHHRAMTPESVQWNTVKKKDIYGISLVFGLLGLCLCLIYFFLS